MKLLAISGFKRSGKDTLADYLVENYNAKRTSFAGPLKDNVARDFSIPREWCDDPNFKEKALLKYPVTPKDAFGMNIVKFMFKEFRSLEGDTATHFVEEKNMGLCGHELKVLYHTPRSLCILEGSTKRSVDSSYWVQQAIKEVLVNNGLSVISDARYKSEMNQLREAFGDSLITIRVNRFLQSSSTDPSEMDLNDYTFDHTLNNFGTLAEFHESIFKLMKKI